MRYFTALHSIQYDKFASGVILNEVKNLKKHRLFFIPSSYSFFSLQ